MKNIITTNELVWYSVKCAAHFTVTNNFAKPARPSFWKIIANQPEYFVGEIVHIVLSKTVYGRERERLA